jgi:NTP pyrophosphatase (non-canonical NTP hydrolase)
MKMNKIIEQVKQWHDDRNLIDGSTDKDQYLKLLEEVFELQNNIMKGRPIIDDIGDIIVVLINIAERNGLTLEQCLEHAYNDIKDRKGRMIEGIFVKDK